MLTMLQRLVYFFICIILLYWIGKYLHIVDICIWIFHICMPLFLAFLFRFILDPVISIFHKVNRKVVCSIVYAIIILLFFALLYVIIPRFIQQCVYIYTNYDLTNLDNYIHPFFKPMYDFLVSIKIFDVLLGMLQTAINGFMYWGSNILIGFGISFYLVFDDISVCKLVKKSKLLHQDRIVDTLENLKQTTYAFFKASFLDFVVFFVGSYLVFLLIGLDFLLYISIFLAATNLIPYIGPFIGGIPVIVYGFTIDISIGYMCVFAVLLLQLVESNFIQPMLFKKCLSTNPVVLIIALTIFGDWFGITGMIVTPLILSYISIIKKAIMVERTT